MRSKRYKQGRYKLTRPSKYRGDPNNVWYRSSWELKFMIFCEMTPSVTEWGSEEIKIPYVKPSDGRVHRYVPDFYMKMGNDKYIIEVKPERETKEPVMRKSARGKRTLGVSPCPMRLPLPAAKTIKSTFIMVFFISKAHREQTLSD